MRTIFNPPTSAAQRLARQSTPAHWRTLAAASAVSALLAACGGGGSTDARAPELNGVAASGAALQNANITVVDSVGKECVSTTANNSTGSWTVSLANCGAAPYLIVASGTTTAGEDVVYHSAATDEDVKKTGQAGTTVTTSQLTDTQVKLALQTDDPKALVASAVGTADTPLKALTVDALKAASVQVLAVLPDETKTQIASEVAAGKDIRTLAVVAGSGQGLDKVLDRVPKVQFNVAEKVVVASVTGFGADKTGTVNVAATINSTTKTLVPMTSATEVLGVPVIAKTDATAAKQEAISPEDSAKAETAALMGAVDALWKTAVPATGALAASNADMCYLNGGATRAFNIDRYDGKLDVTAEYMRQVNAYRVGATRSNFKLLSLVISEDKKTKAAVVSYDITYKDGTKALDTQHTMVWGDSGPVCKDHNLTDAKGAVLAGENRKAWRFVGDKDTGNQVDVGVEALNRLIYTRSLTDGTVNKNAAGTTVVPLVLNGLVFSVSDPRQLGYTYAVVTGPTLPSAGIKLLLPATVRNAAELKGKVGHFANDTSRFESARMCTLNAAGASNISADQVDCVGKPSSVNPRLYPSASSLATLTGNDTFTFKIYNDDSWKTVNGHAGKTPALTYTQVLKAKPFDSTVSKFPSAYWGGSSGSTAAPGPVTAATTNSVFSNDSIFPLFEAMTDADLTRLLTAFKVDTSTEVFKGKLYAPQLPSGAKARAITTLWNYSSGQVTSDATAIWPKFRKNDRTRLLSDASTYEATVKGKSKDIAVLDYTEVGVSTSDRNGHLIETVYVWQ